MKVIHRVSEMQHWSRATSCEGNLAIVLRGNRATDSKGNRPTNRKGKTIGFVPTMGFLHEGHLSLIRAARKENDRVVVSIFVNPLQFGPNEDFLKYPRDLERDKKLLEKEKVDVLFHPTAEEMYGHNRELNMEQEYTQKYIQEYQHEYIENKKNGIKTSTKARKKQKNKESITINLPKNLTNCLCGKFRPGHFAGVATVVAKLFNIVRPNTVYFGQKDFQQTVIISWLIKTLNFPLRMRVIPTVRESDGLAMSSRNVYLSKEERKAAPLIYQSLLEIKRLYKQGERNPRVLERKFRDLINQNKIFKLEYAEIRKYNNLELIKSLKFNNQKKLIDNIKKIEIPKGKYIFTVAAYIGKIRSIDNVILT